MIRRSCLASCCMRKPAAVVAVEMGIDEIRALLRTISRPYYLPAQGAIATRSTRDLRDRSPCGPVHVARATFSFSYPSNFSVSDPVSRMTNSP